MASAVPARTETGKPSGVLRPTGRPPSGPGSRNTAVLIGFTAATNLADGVMKMALPLLAVQLTGSPAQVTAVSLTLTLPWLVVALHVGVLVDRFDRRRLLWVANGMRLAAMAGSPSPR